MSIPSNKNIHRLSLQTSKRRSLGQPTDDNNVRQLAQLRATSPRNEQKPSSLAKQQQHASRRASLAALTASARAKQVARSPKKTEDAQQQQAVQQQRRNTIVINTKTNTETSTSARQTRPRSISVKTDRPMLTRRISTRKPKECCKDMTNGDDDDDEEMIGIDKKLLLKLLDDRNSSDVDAHAAKDASKPQLGDDGETGNFYPPHSTKVKAKRRQSMPPPIRNEDDKPNDGFYKELSEIKQRLQRLEVKNTDERSNPTSPASSVNSPPSVFDRLSTHTPSSPSSQTTAHTLPRLTIHQKRLQDAFAIFEQKQQRCTPVVKTMATVVAETIAMNQKIWAAIPQDLNTDARSLISMQKSSDNQVRELTEALYLLGGEPDVPSDALVLSRYRRGQSHISTEGYVPLAQEHYTHNNNTTNIAVNNDYKPLISSRYSQIDTRPRASSLSRPSYHYNYRTSATAATHGDSAAPATFETLKSGVLPYRVAGVLDYQAPVRSKYYDHYQQRYTTSFYD